MALLYMPAVLFHASMNRGDLWFLCSGILINTSNRMGFQESILEWVFFSQKGIIFKFILKIVNTKHLIFY